MSACDYGNKPPCPTPAITMPTRIGFSPYASPSFRKFSRCDFSASQDYVHHNDASTPGHTDTRDIERHYSFAGHAEYIAGVLNWTIDSSAGSFTDVRVNSADPGGDFSHSGSGSLSPTTGTTTPVWVWTGDDGGVGNPAAAIIGSNPYSRINLFTDAGIYTVTSTVTTADAGGSDGGTIGALTYTESDSYSAELSDDVPVTWQIKHGPTASCYLKVWLRKEITPTGGGAVTYEDLDPYVWEGTGPLCLLNLDAPVDDPTNEIVSEIFELPIPVDDVQEIVEIVKWSYLPNYEPDISDPGNPQPNGFPGPE